MDNGTTTMLHGLWNLTRSTRAATAVEYGLIAALIAVAAISAMTSLGTKVSKTFTNASNNMKVS